MIIGDADDSISINLIAVKVGMTGGIGIIYFVVVSVVHFEYFFISINVIGRIDIIVTIHLWFQKMTRLMNTMIRFIGKIRF